MSKSFSSICDIAAKKLKVNTSLTFSCVKKGNLSLSTPCYFRQTVNEAERSGSAIWQIITTVGNLIITQERSHRVPSYPDQQEKRAFYGFAIPAVYIMSHI